MRVLFLDDDLYRVEEFIQNTNHQVDVDHCFNVQQFIKALEDKVYDVIMLDHDLGEDADGTNNGGEAAKFLANNRCLLGSKTVIIHSANPIGVANMMSYLKHADHLTVFAVAFAWQKVRWNNGELAFAV